MNDEMKDLAARMAADEASEGNYAAAAELQAAVTLPMSEVPGHEYEAPDHCAWTDPMCPEPMETGSMFCHEHRTVARQNTLRGVLRRYFGMLGGTTAENAEERVDVTMDLVDLVAGHPVPGELVTSAKRVEELEANERTRQFVTKSLDRLKPQLARRIAEVIEPEDSAQQAAERLVEKGLRFAPTDAEVELAQKYLRFIVACTSDQDFLQEWDGQLFADANDPTAQGDLEDVRERLDSFGRRLSGGATEPSNWGVFGLVRVPDEAVFGKRAGQ